MLLGFCNAFSSSDSRNKWYENGESLDSSANEKVPSFNFSKRHVFVFDTLLNSLKSTL